MEAMHLHMTNMCRCANFWHSQMLNSSLQSSKQSYSEFVLSQFVLKMSASCFHACLSRQRHCLTAEWTKNWFSCSHSSTCFCNLHTSGILFLYTLSWISPYILSEKILSKHFAPYFLLSCKDWSNIFFHAKSDYGNNTFTVVTITLLIAKNI